jgi:S-adenosyl-L-methionine hydrolase (adenosine-forming)
VLPITFLSDYGHDDEFVGVCHGVIQRIAPGAIVIDVVHGLPRQDVRTAALTLRRVLAYMPKGVHLAVVDPEVGTARRPLAVRCLDGHVLVGPDNGVLWPAIERCGGVETAVNLDHTPYRLEPVSATFHGRDIFAPVAARLALETPIEHAGSPVAPGDLVRIDLPRPKVAEGEVTARVLSIDRFGNVQLNVYRDQLAKAGFGIGNPVRIQAGRKSRRAVYAHTFAEVNAGEAIVYEDSTRAIAIAVNGGSAAAVLAVEPDSELKLKPWPRRSKAPAEA